MTKFINYLTKIFHLTRIIAKVLIFIFIRRVIDFEKLINTTHKQKYTKISKDFLIKYSNFIFRFFFIKNCFTRSLVLRELLLKSGENADIEIGIKKENGILISHCWIKSDGKYTEKKSVRNDFKLLDMG
tara:strand:+ start:56 stop:442 length:387 start_codon:yes stop_codon:yes gene_type:complete